MIISTLFSRPSRTRNTRRDICRRHPRAEQLETRTLLSAGDLDLSFGVGGKVETDFGSTEDIVTDVAIQADGKIVVVGSSSDGTNTDFALARYNYDGTLDTTFSFDGKVTTDLGAQDEIAGVAIQSDGKIIVAGVSDHGFPDRRLALARYNADGTLDSDFFGINGTVVSVAVRGASAVALQDDGRIVVAGSASIPGGGGSLFAFARFQSDGSFDSSFGNAGVSTIDGGGSADLSDLAIQKGGIIFASGGQSGSTAAVAVYPNGNLRWRKNYSFTEGSSSSEAIAIQDDRRAVIVGGAGGEFAISRVRYLDGTLDQDFDADGRLVTQVSTGSDRASDVMIQPNQKIVAAGTSANGSVSTFALARYLPDGTLDPQFGAGAGTVTTTFNRPSGGKAVVMQSDGKILVAGFTGNLSFSTGLANADFALARYEGDSPIDKFGVVQLGPALTVTGSDDDDPPIIFSDNGEGAISVITTEDGRQAKYFGIENVVINTGDGSDDVTYAIDLNAAPADFSPASLQIDMGGGDADSFDFVADLGRAPALTGAEIPEWTIDLAAAGATVNLDLQNISTVAPSIRFNESTDRGVESETHVTFDIDVTGLRAPLVLDADLGTLDSTFGVDLRDIFAPVILNVTGASGAHDVNIVGLNPFDPFPDMPSRLQFATELRGNADNTVAIDVRYFAEVAGRIIGGEGDDIIDVLGKAGFNPQPEPPGSLEFVVETGGGDDQVNLDIEGTPPDPEDAVGEVFNVPEVTLSVLTSGGDDSVGAQLAQVSADIDFQTGSEDDQLHVSASFERDPAIALGRSPLLNVDVDSGSGDDNGSFTGGRLIDAGLRMSADLGSGDDTWLTALSGDMTGGDLALFDVRGESGQDSISLITTATDGVVSTPLAVRLNGGNGPDNQSVEIKDMVFQTDVDIELSGGSASDEQTVEINDASLQGRADILIKGHSGNERQLLRMTDVVSSGGFTSGQFGHNGDDELDTVLNNVRFQTPVGESPANALLLSGGSGDDKSIMIQNRLTVDAQLFFLAAAGRGDDSHTTLLSNSQINSGFREVVRTEGGDDGILNIASNVGRTTVHETVIRTNSGDDRFGSADLPNDALLSFQETGTLPVVTGGRLVDLAALILPEGVSGRIAEVDFSTTAVPDDNGGTRVLDANTGSGADTAILASVDSTSAVDREIRIKTGSGADDLSLSFNRLTLPDTTDLTIELDSQRGEDNIVMEVLDGDISGRMHVNIRSGSAEDVIREIWDGTALRPGSEVNLVSDSGSGGDDVDVSADGFTIDSVFSHMTDTGHGDDVETVVFDNFTMTTAAQVSLFSNLGSGPDVSDFRLIGDVSGVLNLNAETGTGDDEILRQLNLDIAADGVLTTFAQTGDGADQLTENSSGTVAGRWITDIRTGPGDDIGTWSVEDSVFVTGSEVNATIDGSSENDTLQHSLTNTTLQAGSSVVLDSRGDSGLDTQGIIIVGGNVAAGALLQAMTFGGSEADQQGVTFSNTTVAGAVGLRMHGGGGDDNQSVMINGGSVAAGAQIQIDGSGDSGNDATATSFDGTQIDGVVLQRLNGQTGDDSLETTLTNVTIGGVFDSELNGERDNDVLSSTVSGGELSASGSLRLVSLADRGNDQITDVIQALLAHGILNIAQDGDRGNDVHSLTVDLDDESLGSGDFNVFAGRGDDDLTGALFAPAGFNALSALLDGGSGNDVCNATGFVAVRCEA